MSDFVEECRREWRRLGVPDRVANEMADDLRADLEEAAAEGATLHDVLGSGAFDPRAFATAWAAERGVIGRSVPSPRVGRRPAGLPVAIAALALIAIIGAVLVISDRDSGDATRGLLAPPRAATGEIRVVAPPVAVSPDGRSIWVGPDGEGTIFSVRADDGAGDTARIVGSVLLSLALAAILLATLFWWWRGSDRWPSRHAY